MPSFLIGGTHDGKTIEAPPSPVLLIHSAPTGGSVETYHRGNLQDADGTTYLVYTFDTPNPVRRLLDAYAKVARAARVADAAELAAWIAKE